MNRISEMQEKATGITMISLIITIIIMCLIVGVTVDMSIDNLRTKDLSNLYADLKTLKDNISAYYNQYGTLPLGDKFTGSYEFATIANPNDDPEGYYVIDISKIKNLLLVNEPTWSGEDVFIINTKTHTIYYPAGITLDNEIYYRLPGEYSELAFGIIKMSVNPNALTKNDVTVTADWTKVEGEVTKQISTDGGTTWQEVTGDTTQTTVTQNGLIKARALENGNEVFSTSIRVENIDKLPPNEFEVMASSSDWNSITVTGETTDQESSIYACSGVKEYYFKIDGGEWKKNGDSLRTYYTFTGLEPDSNHSVEMKAVDYIGNETTTTAKNVTTKSITEGEIKIIASKIGWTTDPVTLTVIWPWPNITQNFKKEISIDGGTTWDEYTGEVEVTSNCTVKAKMTDPKDNSEIVATLTVNNIDANSPIVTATEGEEKILCREPYLVSTYFTYDSNGNAPISNVIYSVEGEEIENTNVLEPGTHIITCTVIKSNGMQAVAQKKIIIDETEYEFGNVTANGLAARDITIKTDVENIQIVIPTGFAPVILEGSGTTSSLPGESGAVLSIMPYEEWYNITAEQINKGIVIVDNVITYDNGNESGSVPDFNEYVWVPIPQSSDFARVAWVVGGSTTTVRELADTSTEYAYWEDTKTNEYTNMVASVNKNKGFYIGRYETNSNTERIAQSKRNQAVWTNVTHDNALVACTNNTYTENMHLIYGIEWDSTLKWLQDNAIIAAETNGETRTMTLGDIQTKSITWGNYWDTIGDAETNSGTGHVTGKSEFWKANNIYDLAGNYAEFTQEFYSTSGSRTVRGYSYQYTGNSYGYNETTNPAADCYGTSYSSYSCGFRVSFYI